MKASKGFSGTRFTENKMIPLDLKPRSEQGKTSAKPQRHGGKKKILQETTERGVPSMQAKSVMDAERALALISLNEITYCNQIMSDSR